MTPCDISNSALNGLVSKLDFLNRKFTTLRRLGELLENAVDPSRLVPFLPNLINVNSITLDTYQQLRSSCPFLGLPDIYDDGLGQLQGILFGAYQDLVNKLKIHPWSKLGKLQDELDRIQSSINVAFADVEKYLLCANAACATVDLATRQTVSTYQENFVDNQNGVLTESMREKSNQINGMITQLQTLTST